MSRTDVRDRALLEAGFSRYRVCALPSGWEIHLEGGAGVQLTVEERDGRLVVRTYEGPADARSGVEAALPRLLSHWVKLAYAETYSLDGSETEDRPH